MKKTLLKLPILALALLLPALLHAQARPSDPASLKSEFGEESPSALSFMEKSSRTGASPEFTAKVLEEAKRLRERGLPAEPYLLKASEGLAKGAPPAKIGGALENTRRQTEEAEKLVNRTLERRGLSSSPAVKREAISNFQKALFLNETSPRRLEKWLDERKDISPSKDSLQKIGKEAREFSRTKKEKDSLERKDEKTPPDSFRKKENKRDSPREPKKQDRKWREDRSTPDRSDRSEFKNKDLQRPRLEKSERADDRPSSPPSRPPSGKPRSK